MKDEEFPLLEPVGDEPLEARIVAWVLGDASAFEAAELERLCEERPELLVFRRRMQALHGLLSDAEAAKPDEAWKLPAEKRAKLDALFGGMHDAPAGKKVIPLAKHLRQPWIRQALMATAACVTLAVGFNYVFSPTKQKVVMSSSSERTFEIQSSGIGDPSYSPPLPAAPRAKAQGERFSARAPSSAILMPESKPGEVASVGSLQGNGLSAGLGGSGSGGGRGSSGANFGRDSGSLEKSGSGTLAMDGRRAAQAGEKSKALAAHDEVRYAVDKEEPPAAKPSRSLATGAGQPMASAAPPATTLPVIPAAEPISESSRLLADAPTGGARQDLTKGNEQAMGERLAPVDPFAPVNGPAPAKMPSSKTEVADKSAEIAVSSGNRSGDEALTRGNTDFRSPVNGTTVDGVPAATGTNVTDILTGGLRSGDSAINRNSIDAVLNNPDRVAKANGRQSGASRKAVAAAEDEIAWTDPAVPNDHEAPKALTGANTYTGKTTISAGDLQIDGDVAANDKVMSGEGKLRQLQAAKPDGAEASNILTSGLRSGDSTIKRESIDAILNNPNRVAGGGVGAGDVAADRGGQFNYSLKDFDADPAPPSKGEPETAIVDGRRVRIGHIDIRGNAKTTDNVIRREVPLKQAQEGQQDVVAKDSKPRQETLAAKGSEGGIEGDVHIGYSSDYIFRGADMGHAEAGADVPSRDPDGDGFTNADEYPARKTAPARRSSESSNYSVADGSRSMSMMDKDLYEQARLGVDLAGVQTRAVRADQQKDASLLLGREYPLRGDASEQGGQPDITNLPILGKLFNSRDQGSNDGVAYSGLDVYGAVSKDFGLAAGSGYGSVENGNPLKRTLSGGDMTHDDSIQPASPGADGAVTERKSSETKGLRDQSEITDGKETHGRANTGGLSNFGDSLNGNGSEEEAVNLSLKDTKGGKEGNPALAYGPTQNVEKVRKELYTGEGAYNLGKFDDAKKQFEEVLRTDPNNTVAQRWMEKIASAKSEYYRSAYDHTRAELLMQTDQALALPVPTEKPASEVGLKTDLSEPEALAAEKSPEREGITNSDGTISYDWAKGEYEGAQERLKELQRELNNSGIQARVENSESDPTKAGGKLTELEKQIRDQKDRVEERLKLLNTLVRLKAVIPSGDTSQTSNRLEKGAIKLVESKALVATPAAAAAAPKPAPVPTGETPSTDEPFSTFSLHVSDASFKLAKAALDRGERLSPDQIRPEEFYNAFDYGDPSPAPGEPVACAIEQTAHPILPQRNLVRIAMRVGSAGRGQGQPLNLTVLLDNSGSMEREDRRAGLRAAVAQLASLLKAGDTVTLAGFSRTPHLLADRLSGAEAAKLVALVDNLPSEGGTNLEEALKLAGELAVQRKNPAAQNRIVLLTDGAANLGNAQPEDLANKVAALRQQGIAFDAAGIGAGGLNDRMLEALTRHGNGRYYIVNDAADADCNFATQLAGAFRPAAENVKVQVHFNPDRVARYKLIGFEKHRLNTEDFHNDAVDAAELAADEAGVALYQVEVLPEGTGELGEVSVRFRDTASATMVERSWTIPHDEKTPAFDRASASIQLATLSELAAEKLRDTPLGQATDFTTLVPELARVRSYYGTSSRVGELLQMTGKLK